MALPTDFPSNAAWIVTDQAPDQVIVTDSGRVVTGTYVFFATAEGNTGSLFVDDGHYNAKAIKPALHARASLVDQIGNLTADTHV